MHNALSFMCTQLSQSCYILVIGDLGCKGLLPSSIYVELELFYPRYVGYGKLLKAIMAAIGVLVLMVVLELILLLSKGVLLCLILC